MTSLAREMIFSDSKDLPSPGWLTALGILLLFGTILQEIAGSGLSSPVELVEIGTNFLSILLP